MNEWKITEYEHLMSRDNRETSHMLREKFRFPIHVRYDSELEPKAWNPVPSFFEGFP